MNPGWQSLNGKTSLRNSTALRLDRLASTSGLARLAILVEKVRSLGHLTWNQYSSLVLEALDAELSIEQQGHIAGLKRFD